MPANHSKAPLCAPVNRNQSPQHPQPFDHRELAHKLDTIYHTINVCRLALVSLEHAESDSIKIHLFNAIHAVDDLYTQAHSLAEYEDDLLKAEVNAKPELLKEFLSNGGAA